ncbi:MAG TPA: serine/threonine-protein kinase [Micavibrio sp.]|nr:serine/threonine-protein kinase [Micavibrio sp.]
MSDVTVQDEPVKKAESPPVAPPPQTSALAGDVVFNESITINAGSRLPQYDRGLVKAYTASGTNKAPANLFALICEDHLTPRIHKASNYAAIVNPSLTHLAASGVVDWTPAGKEKYCFIYKHSLGNPLMKDDLRGALGMKPDVALNAVIRPLVSVLADLRDKDIFHGNIRVSNIFDGGSKNIERAVLGECLSCPVSYLQPVLYETIDRALCAPIGRGPGTSQDDIYALGVSLAMMLRHSDPMEGLSDEEIIERKMEEGSYSALLGKDRLTGQILELMRGLLYDDENQRWTIDEVMVWLDGRRLSSKQTSRRVKANRPVTFQGKKYSRPELLVNDFKKNPGEARQLIEDGELEQWLSRALEDKPATARFENAVRLAEEGGKGSDYPERLATRVSIALHPEGPISYRNISVLPEGVGPALTEAFIMKRDLQSYHDFFMNYFITQWIDCQAKNVPDVSNLVGRFDSARAFLRIKGLGGGLEKCIYAMNPEVHCLSEKVAKFYIRSPEDLMRAYEKISANSNHPALFFDRHIAAFLSVKDRKNIDPHLYDMNAPETYRRVLAEAKTLATIQKRSQMEKFPGIAKWMVENLGPVYERFHDRELREKTRKAAERLIVAGDLAKIVLLFDDPAVYQNDNIEFRRAMRQYHDLEQETIEIERALRNEATLGLETGHQVAAIVAGILAGIVIMASAFSGFGQNVVPF